MLQATTRQLNRFFSEKHTDYNIYFMNIFIFNSTYYNIHFMNIFIF